MPTREIYRGEKFEIRAWLEADDSCPVLDFLDELESDGDSDFDRLNYLIARTAEHGVPRNIQHVRSLGDDIYEFKAPGTARILFFYDKGRLIICSHGFTGKPGKAKKKIANEKTQAQKIRKAYFNEKR